MEPFLGLIRSIVQYETKILCQRRRSEEVLPPRDGRALAEAYPAKAARIVRLDLLQLSGGLEEFFIAEGVLWAQPRLYLLVFAPEICPVNYEVFENGHISQRLDSQPSAFEFR